MTQPRLRFGIFMAPFHPVHENPALALQRDFELIERLDELGYDEAWIGEHHSAGYEIIASPEVFIAGAAERTRRIRLGTGVSSLPYHHPLMLADRIMQLDYQTRGRVMFGVGPGALPSDAFMMGIDPLRQRDMMTESIRALVPLLRGETVTMKTDWFELNEAKLQLVPYTEPHVEIAVASQVSPAGARAAGEFGLGLLSIGATSTGGFNALSTNWNICEQRAKEFDQKVDRSAWRLVGPVHIAETREQARKDVEFGLDLWLKYFREIAALPLAPEGGTQDAVDLLNESGLAVIGSVDDMITQLERLEEQSGGYGCFMNMAHEWADRDATLHSYELIARYVMPRFQHTNQERETSMKWAGENRPRFIGTAMQAIGNEMQKHANEQAEKNAQADAAAKG
ncbi:MAG: LLM class flavin-dependent oxidoreductase [Deltaproteobacteria bacterium]|nr:LLM class flavin-dependent oxidoreductase [Deltaproteobacteria bacterium]MBW2413676.1 LLM class flavin-dependent oxidoreductase [Deltaproteobacteria bacterium]